MVATLYALLQLAAVTPPADSLAGAFFVAADTSIVPPRVVRQFPAVEVRSLLHDARAGQTVREIPAAALRAYPAEGLADLVALQPGVVAYADELHVRGGRAGETRLVLEGVTLNEPLRHRPMDVPVFALRGAELVSGAPESRHGGALAGVLDLQTVDPDGRFTGEGRWSSDGGLDTRYDRVSLRLGAPLRLLGLGMVAAGDATLDDTSLPALRSAWRDRVAGMSFGWRAENRLLGFLKLAPIAGPRRFAAQVLASRTVSRPYDPAWSLDGWSGFDGLGFAVFSPVPLPGYQRYRAADHKAITDDRRQAALVTASTTRGRRHGTLAAGWLRTRTATTVGGVHAIPAMPRSASFDSDLLGDPFHVIGGDDPLYRVSGSDVWSLRGDAEFATRGGSPIRAGLGASHETVWLDELDATLLNLPGAPVDSVRAYRARAPGAFAYAQTRWRSGGMVLNAGLRVEYFTPGAEGARQTLPGSAGGRFSLLPRIGIAHPLSTRDVFSISYTRTTQTPERDLLYDRRVSITNRQPLGNPALLSATMISYEAALKHLFSAVWALQASFFYRDVAHLAGARDYQTSGGPVDLRYTDEDQASSSGLELSVVRDRGEGNRLEAHYTFMHAWGFESRPEGDPYGPLQGVNTPPIAEQPLSWDRRHSLVVSGLRPLGRRATVAWSSRVGSPLPWTPKPRRQPPTDVTTVNSRRFGWSAVTHLRATWSPPRALGVELGFEVRNLFDDRSERAATVDGFPNPVVNTYFDDYGAYRTETGRGGGAYWSNAGGTGHWVPVGDARLTETPRTMRASVGRRW